MRPVRASHWLWLPVAAVSTPVCATNYLSVEQAQQAIFPGARFESLPLPLSDEQREAIAKSSGSPVSRHEAQSWRVGDAGYFFVDEVVGKHELITFAVGLNADGTIRQVEILAYREPYGYEIRNERWRRQFVGKRAPLRMDHDIQNISGATLSCTHLTQAINRILALYDVVLRH